MSKKAMKHSAEIYNELKGVSPFLAEVEKTNVFSVPEDYFSALDKQFLQKIKDDLLESFQERENSSFTLPASELHFLDVPEGYFDNLPTNILKKIKSLEIDDTHEELKRLSPMLYAVQNENVFSVPGGYFESLPGVIINAIRPQAKIIAIKKRSMVWDYAVAAMLCGVMAISALWVSNDSSNQNGPGSIAKVNTTLSYIKEASQYKNQQQINEGISNLADDDIIKYLEITGNNADDELLSNVIQENELPDEKDYLLNEHTLETFLNNANLKNTTN